VTECSIAVDSGDKNKTTIATFQTGALTVISVPWRSYMVRPRDLAVRVSDAQHRDTFRLKTDGCGIEAPPWALDARATGAVRESRRRGLQCCQVNGASAWASLRSLLARQLMGWMAP
jgi:hypothetical protein